MEQKNKYSRDLKKNRKQKSRRNQLKVAKQYGKMTKSERDPNKMARIFLFCQNINKIQF